ncbi:unnamed protein product [Musa textilis]
MQRDLVSSGGGDCLGVSMASAPSPFICNSDDFLSPCTIFSTIDTAPLPASGSFAISPSSVSFEEVETSSTATEDRLCLARLALQYREITERYGICLSHLCDTAEEVESLRRENASLRTANGELARRIDLLPASTLVVSCHPRVWCAWMSSPASASPKRRSPETAPRACSPFRRVAAVATGRQPDRWRRSISHHRRSPPSDPADT